MAPRPVVIQTMWRTGGTYLAFMLRERNPVALFYEPLHEDYSRFTKAEWDGFAKAGAEAARGHPRKPFHYLTDYPFRPGGGVAGHRPEFASGRFVLREGDEAPALAAYLDGLVAHARDLGRQPLFKFCRGFLRQPWLKAALDPVTLYLARDPAGMIGSYDRIGGGGYFYSGYLRILAQNRHEPRLAAAHDYVGSRHPDYLQADEALLASDRLAATVSAETARDVFLFFWALALAEHATPDMLMVDANALAVSRRDQAEALQDHTGLDVDLADAVGLDKGQANPIAFQARDFRALLRAALPPVDLARAPALLRAQFERLVATQS